MKKYCFFIIFFFLILIVPILFIERKHNVSSSIDNRKLVEFPSIGNENFFIDFDKALNDRIGLRDEIITAYIIINDKLFHVMEHPTYTYGKKGYVFFKIHKNIEYGEFHQTFVQAVKKMSDYCEERGIKFYFLFNPEKLSVYRRYLPAGVNYNDNWVDTLIQNLEEQGVCCVNNSAYLSEKSFSEQVFNRKYDAGHWNDLGMFYGMNQLFSKMHEDFPNIRELTFDDFIVTEKIERSLPVSKFPIKETVPNFQANIEIDNKTKLYNVGLKLHPSYTAFHYYERTDNSKLPKVLVFQGSYLNHNGNYMINNASVDIGVHNYQNVLDLDYYVNMFQPDAVVFEVAEYVFKNNYFDQQKMELLDFNPTLNAEQFTLESEIISSILVPVSDMYVNYYVGIPDKKVHYAWLISKNKIFDLKKVADNLYSVVTSKDVLGDTATLFIQDEEERKSSVLVESLDSKDENLLIELNRTANVQNTENGGYTYSTKIDDNTFSYVAIQLYNPRKDTYYNIHHSYVKGKFMNVYFHNEESGDYIINLRGNTNIEDEYVQYNVKLEHNKLYVIEYSIDNISSKSVTVSDFVFK